MTGAKHVIEFTPDRQAAAIKLLHLCKQFVFDYNNQISSFGHFDNPYHCIFVALHNFDGKDFVGLEFPEVEYDPRLNHLGKAFVTNVKKHMGVPAEQDLDKHQAKLIYDVLHNLTEISENELNVSDEEFLHKMQKPS